MIGAALLVKSYRALASTTLGFEEKGILSFRITLPSAKYESLERRVAFYETLQQRLQALPSVASVGLAQGIPFSGWNVQASVDRERVAEAEAGRGFRFALPVRVADVLSNDRASRFSAGAGWRRRIETR